MVDLNSIDAREWKNIPLTTSNIGVDRNSFVILIQFLFGSFFIILWNIGYIGGTLKYESAFEWIIFFLTLPPAIFGNIYLFVFVVAALSSFLVNRLKKNTLHRRVYSTLTPRRVRRNSGITSCDIGTHVSQSG